MKTKTNSMSTRVLKEDALRLQRKLVVHMTSDEYERVRRESAPETISTYVRSVIREKIHAQR